MTTREEDRDAALIDIFTAIQHVIIDALEGYTTAQIDELDQITHISDIITATTTGTVDYAYSAGLTRDEWNVVRGNEWLSSPHYIGCFAQHRYEDISRIIGMPQSVATGLINAYSRTINQRARHRKHNKLPGGLVKRLKDFIPQLKQVGGASYLITQLNKLVDTG